MEMMTLKTPVISILIGEGGSGGALALAVADEVWMLENSIYSVISPEGCASILWRDASKVKEAAECLKLTSKDLLELGGIERIIKEPKNFKDIYKPMRQLLKQTILQKQGLDVETLVQNRYERFRKIGVPE